MINMIAVPHLIQGLAVREFLGAVGWPGPGAGPGAGAGLAALLHLPPPVLPGLLLLLQVCPGQLQEVPLPQPLPLRPLQPLMDHLHLSFGHHPKDTSQKTTSSHSCLTCVP